MKCKGNCNQCGKCKGRYKVVFRKSNRRALMRRKARKLVGLNVTEIHIYKLNRDVILKRKNKYLGRYYKKFLKSRRYSSWGRGR